MKISERTSGVSLHFEKHKANDVGVNGLQRHNERVPGQKHKNENIDDTRTADNVFLKRSDGKFNKQVEETIMRNKTGGMKNVRKNSVRMVEATVQLSGKVLDMSEDEQEQVLRDSYDWLKNEFGEDNVISAVIHKDETNMHLHFDYVPITDDKRLSANDILTKPKLHKYQSDFLKDLKEKHLNMNFERGGGELNGLSQKDFEKVQQIVDDNNKELNNREKELDNREDELDDLNDEMKRKRKTLSKRELQNKKDEQANKLERERLQKREEELNKAIKKQQTNTFLIRQQYTKRNADLGQREKAVNEKDEQADIKLSTADKKLSEASEKLLEANRIKQQYEKLLKRIETIKEQTSEIANRVTAKVTMMMGFAANGLIKSDKVKKTLKPFEQVTSENMNQVEDRLDGLADNMFDGLKNKNDEMYL